MRSLKPAAAAALFLVCAGEWMASPPADLLVRLGGASIVDLPDGLASRVLVVQACDSFSIALVSEEVAGRLADAGAAVEVLDRAPGGKAYFLVAGPPAASALPPPGRGGFRPLGEGHFLFWGENVEAREVFPPGFKIKRLWLEDARPPAPAPGSGAAGDPRPAGLAAAGIEPLIPEIASRVSAPNMTGTVAALQAFQTRYASTPGCEAAGAFLLDALRSLGLAAELDPFTFSSFGYPTNNIVATLPGGSAADHVVLVCAHYDSYSKEPKTLAPGADDNASGTAAVLELARVFAAYDFALTVKFAAFSAEEWGLYGSRHYAQAARARGEKIVAVLNLDMIGYVDAAPEDLDVIVDPDSIWLANLVENTVRTYGSLPLLRLVNRGFTYSDHAPFWDAGFSAFCGIEDASPKNPYYHKTTDTLTTLDMGFAADVTRAMAAVAANLARPLRARQ